ncbi:NADPH:quinone reductase-like Zn-dependent oxidoreductase [Novosphingobium chloroacetimidivorans]|uniref:NADPH:quinone reductase-like Zn-dependent oxidoreductase n=1 Tax=Novosphingobium chloroacetimidivorans TaxID=1428314 RepID=A0A7W7NWY6_9SPHN|nr:NADP-dependent oxidoreductase [Novosphingobium chloroacetimidivorans]MBB4858635.1 NADPH:quinone reductase-like Zn-dependent oxidoreductase [Novosphingobium chloroacetimidivorans]
MKAVQLAAYGGVDQLSLAEWPRPEPGPGEVLLRIHASAVNPFDLLVREGIFAQFIPLPLPAVPGGDAAGTIEALGEGVQGYDIGDRVIADFPTAGRGSHAEFGVISVNAIAPLPDQLDFEHGAALPKAGLTGRQAVAALGVTAGERVLVSGALGSVGRAVLQQLQAIGAVPVAGVRADRLDEAAALGVEAIDLSDPADDPRFDRAIATAGSATSQLLGRVRDGGRVVSIVPVPEEDNAGGRVEVIQLYHQTDAETLAQVARDAAEGRLVIPIAATFPLEALAEAHAAVAAGARGKVVLRH